MSFYGEFNEITTQVAIIIIVSFNWQSKKFSN